MPLRTLLILLPFLAVTASGVDVQLLSARAAGVVSTAAANDCLLAAISSDARYTLFSSQAANLVSGDGNGAYDVFRHDNIGGGIIRVSLAADGSELSGNSYAAFIDDTGRYAVFTHAIVVSSGLTKSQVWRKDIQTGALTLVSTRSDGQPGNDNSYFAAATRNGQYVAFSSSASDISAGATYVNLYRRDLNAAGTTCMQVNFRVNGTVLPSSYTFEAGISDNGQFITFVPSGSDSQVLRRNLTAGTTLAVGINNANNAAVFGREPKISADGRYVVYRSGMTADGAAVAASTTMLWRRDCNSTSSGHTLRMTKSGASDYVDASRQVWDMTTDATAVYVLGRRSVDTSDAVYRCVGTTSNAVAVVAYSGLYLPALRCSSTGSVLVAQNGWNAAITSPDPGPYNFIERIESGVTSLVSHGVTWTSADVLSGPQYWWDTRRLALSGDGQVAAFMSLATNLVANDTNRALDTFVWTPATGVARQSMHANGAQMEYAQNRVLLSRNGRYLVGTSSDNTDIAGGTYSNVTLRIDRQTGARLAVATDMNGLPVFGYLCDLSSDGRYALFARSDGDVIIGFTALYGVYRKDLDTGVVVRADTTSGNVAVGSSGSINYASARISGDGRYVVFASVADADGGSAGTGAKLYRKDLTAGTVVRVDSDAAGMRAQAAAQVDDSTIGVSADGRYVAFLSNASNLTGNGASPNGIMKVYRKDLTTGEILDLGINPAGVPFPGDIASPAISGDGRFVAFQYVSDRVVYRRDCVAALTNVVSRTAASASPLTGADPVINADGSRVLITSKADLTATATVNVQNVYLVSMALPPTTPIDIDAAPNTVAENVPIGATAGVTVSATDAGSSTITYSLSDNAGGRFSIHPTTGVVTVAATLDYETATSHTITAVASNGDTASPQNFTIAVSNVADLSPVITWPAPAAITYGTSLSTVQLNASANVAGSFTYTSTIGQILAAGDQTLQVSFTPTDGANYLPTSASVILTVLKATPVITWATPTSIVYGTALSAVQLNAAADVAGSFTYTPAIGTILADGSTTLNVTFTPTNIANYLTTTGSANLTITKAPLTVSANSRGRVFGAANPTFTGTVIGMVAGDDISATYASAANATTPSGTYGPSSPEAIVPTVLDPLSRLSRYVLTTVNGTLTITGNQAQTITGFSAFGPHRYGDTSFSITGVTGGGSIQPVVFLSDNPAVATVSGTLVTITGAGTAVISATQVGDATYMDATPVPQILTVTKAALSVTAANGSRAFGAAANPVFTGTIIGVVNGDAITAAYTSSATDTTPVGTYGITSPEAITPSLIDPNSRLGNYTTTVTNGILTVTTSTGGGSSRPGSSGGGGGGCGLGGGLASALIGLFLTLRFASRR